MAGQRSDRLRGMAQLCLCGVATLMIVAASEGRAQKPEGLHMASVCSERIVPEGCGVPVFVGGYGSSMAFCAADSTFWLLTDRGPNVDGPSPESKVFPIPGYAPHVGVFRRRGDSLVPVRKIILKDNAGQPFCGLPNREGDGKTGETAYDVQGRVIGNIARRGIDPEGLALAPDGTFWISDEYGPYVLHFSSGGELLGELNPFNSTLPACYADRRPNRGMEGLTINAAGNVLFGIMQSPLNAPDGNPTGADFVRILAFSLSDSSFREFAYVLEDPANVVSEITFLSDSTFLVLERDGDFPKDGRGFKRVFRISAAQATDISALTPRPEQSGVLPLTVVPVAKELFCDILEAVPGYAHDKPEGMALVGNRVLCIVNDDDFGIGAPGKPDGSVIPKLKMNGDTDRNEVFFIPVR